MNGKLYEVRKGDISRMGAWKQGDTAFFTAALPEGADAALDLYRGTDREPFLTVPLPAGERTGRVAAVSVTLPEDTDCTYRYRIGKKVCSDPYAAALRAAGDGEETEIRAFLGMPPVPAEDFCRPVYEDCVFYKLHVRGFTMRKNGIRHPGTFAGLQEAIPYLQELGIGAVILMPVHEFTERRPGDRRKNYWGYTDGLYFAPKLSYSASGQPEKEFAALVDALHRAGIGCLTEFWFAGEEDPRLVTDVLRHWMLRYRVDGFHLAGEGAWVRAAMRDPLLASARLLVSCAGEAEAAGQRTKTIAEYNGAYAGCIRRFLKGNGSVSPEEAGRFQFRNAAAHAYIPYLADQDGATLADMVSYEKGHNEASGESSRAAGPSGDTWNCGEEGPSRKAAVRKLRERHLRNAVLLLMTAQGAPMLYAGDEVLNSQGGNSNAWCLDDPTGWVTWNRTREAERMSRFVRQAVSFRKAHPVLHTGKPFRMTDYLSCGLPDVSYHSRTAWVAEHAETRQAMAVMLCGDYARREDGRPDDTLYIIYNMCGEEQLFALPEPPARSHWVITADTGAEQVFAAEGEERGPIPRKTKEIAVGARTILILRAAKEGPEA